jgi:hypothetical protein
VLETLQWPSGCFSCQPLLLQRQDSLLNGRTCVVNHEMAQSLAELVGLIHLGPGRFESKHNADFNGGLDPRFAYGGGSLAFGINAASATVKDNYRVYSVMRNFLNAASTDNNSTQK